MSEVIWIAGSYQSQFGLLGAMAREIEAACQELGYDSRLIASEQMTEINTGIVFFMNTPTSIDQLPKALFEPDSQIRAVHYLVDHPFALPDKLLDAWSTRNGLDRYRLCLPCADDAHLLRARFPGLVHRWVPHGIPRQALCPAESIHTDSLARREFDVVVTGSIWSQERIDTELHKLPRELTGLVQDMVFVLLREPHLGYVAAADLVMGTQGVITGDWKTIKLLWALIIAIINRERRRQTLASLQGLRVGVFGSDSWKPECSGTLEYCGEVEYAQCTEAFKRGKIALAWGPTQFVHSYSERIMQAMAAGACVLADDRLLVRRDFKDCCTLFDWSIAQNARQPIEDLLADNEICAKQARRGRAHVEAKCLWSHRVESLLSI
jgi:hypothetical protein